MNIKEMWQQIYDNNSLTREEKEREFMTMCLLHPRPPFPDDHLLKRIWWLPREQRDKYDDLDGIIYGGYFYGGCQSLSKPQVVLVDPLRCIGTTWLFDNAQDPERPYLERLARIMTYSHEDLYAVPATKAGDLFCCGDGNHRIYAAYLLERPVKIRYYDEYTNIKRI